MRAHLRSAAVLGAASLSLVAIAPALAAAPVAQAGANAITLNVGPQEDAYSSGDYEVTNDGSGEQATGQNRPQVDVLNGQELIRFGTLAQDASTTISDRTGSSRACAGLAGQGATAVGVGGTNCLTGGLALTLEAGSLDLSELSIVDDGLTEGLPPEAITLLGTLADGLGTVTSAASTVLAALGDPGLVANLRAIEAECVATPDGVSGSSRLADVNIQLRIPGQDPITVLNLSGGDEVGKDFTADLGQVSDLLLDRLETQLRTGLTGVLSPLLNATQQARVISNILTQVSTQLQPLTGRLISAVTNKQSRTPGAIKVTALDLSILPEAVEGVDGLNLQVGNVACGPNGRTQAAPAAAPSAAASASPTALPTAVSAGYSGTPGARSQGDGDTNTIVLGAFALLVSIGAGFVSYRRLHA